MTAQPASTQAPNQTHLTSGNVSAIAFITVAVCRRRFSWQMVIAIVVVSGLAIFGQSLSPIAVEGLLFALLVAKVSLQVLTAQPVPEAEQVAIKFGDSNH